MINSRDLRIFEDLDGLRNTIQIFLDYFRVVGTFFRLVPASNEIDFPNQDDEGLDDEDDEIELESELAEVEEKVETEPESEVGNKARFLNHKSGRYKIATQNDILAKVSPKYNSIATRHSCNSCHELYEYDIKTPLNKKKIILRKDEYHICYGCGEPVQKLHPVYVFSCVKCGILFQKLRHFSREITGRVGLVVGARTKLGHQILLKLVRAGAHAIGTTRYPEHALKLFQSYRDYDQWKDRLEFYPNTFDLDRSDISNIVSELRSYIEAKHGRLDILVNCAAQTIRVREKGVEKGIIEDGDEKKLAQNRYGDARFVDPNSDNSWQQHFGDLQQREMEEVLRVNSVAPTLIIQGLVPVLKKSKIIPYIINVHAREGQFSVTKSDIHIHTNMAKAALAMLTKCLLSSKLKTEDGESFSIHGCDPGWFSVDEYYEEKRPWVFAPLDEIDGAARILYPVFKNLSGCSITRKHFTQLVL